MSEIANHDVIVVGSGPAGTAAAISCALKGLRVVLIEEQPFPRYCPGETLHPGIEPLLKELGVQEQVMKAGFLRDEGNWVQWEGDRHFVPFGSDQNGPWLGFQAWRADFDAILLERAIHLGVEVLQPCRAIRPIVNHNRVEGVVTSEGEMRSHYVIDATGRRQWLAHKLNITINRYSPRLIVRFGYAEGEYEIRDGLPTILADNHGWIWMAQVRPQIYQWTRLSFEKEVLEKNWLPEEYKGLKPLGKIKGADVTWRLVAKPGGLGFFLTGDAAAVLDPASSHGVLKAIMSGMMAGHLIVQMRKDHQNEQNAIHVYCKWISDWFESDVQELKKLYHLLPYFKKFSC